MRTLVRRLSRGIGRLLALWKAVGGMSVPAFPRDIPEPSATAAVFWVRYVRSQFMALSAANWFRVGRLLSLLIMRSEEHTSELQSHLNIVCRLLLEKKKQD